MAAEVHPLLSFVEKNLRNYTGIITLHIRFERLLITVLFTVVEYLETDVLLDKTFTEKHVLVVILDERKAAVRRTALFTIVKQNELDANADSIEQIRKMRT